MFQNFPLFPEAASTIAGKVDSLYFFLISVSGFFFLLISVLVLVFAVRYRRRPDRAPESVHGSLGLELLWTVIPFVLAMTMFGWGAVIYFDMFSPPEEAMRVYVVGKQWMWKIQHPEGRREINELHVPVGTPVRLVMTSEDVIHSFFIPAFRTKMDVLPGRYTSTWFEATKTGEFHLFCAEYCGTEHSKMVGRVVVMEPEAYEEWLRSDPAVKTMAERGGELFGSLGCAECHELEQTALGPSLHGIYGRAVRLEDGTVVTADEEYLRESILDPSAKITEGWPPVMPTYRGQLTEEDVLDLLAYLKTLRPAAAHETTEGE
ncbi:MAG: cytochrome c oxidase subunit II [Acidobacteriota bacterium]